MSIFLAINCETSVGGVVVWTSTGYRRGIQENRRNGQEESDTVATDTVANLILQKYRERKIQS